MVYRISFTRPKDDYTTPRSFTHFLFPLVRLVLSETVSDEIRTIAQAMLEDYQEWVQVAYDSNAPAIIEEYEKWWYQYSEYAFSCHAKFEVAEDYAITVSSDLTCGKSPLVKWAMIQSEESRILSGLMRPTSQSKV